MDWAKANYERVLVIAAAVFLLLTAVFIWRNATNFGANFVAAQATSPPKPPKPPGKASALETAAQKLQQASQWTFGGRSGLFVPEKHFLGANNLPATLQTTQVHPPVPNEWLEQFNLPIADADVLNQDPDEDGFTNLDEWSGHSNPIDKNSHPDFVTKLKLKAFTEEPFRLKFSSVSGETFGINAIDLKTPTQFLKVGDFVAGTRFKITKYTEKHRSNPATGGEEDVSELQLEHADTHAQLTLILDKIAISPESVATFVYQWPASGQAREFQVRKDQEFSLKPQEEIKYKLIDVQPNKAVIANPQKPNDTIQIGPVGP